jgi:hypothetical protein
MFQATFRKRHSCVFSESIWLLNAGDLPTEREQTERHDELSDRQPKVVRDVREGRLLLVVDENRAALNGGSFAVHSGSRRCSATERMCRALPT